MDNEHAILTRLDRFEEKFDKKMDKLAEAMLTVARVEERQIQCRLDCNKTTDTLWGRFHELEEKVQSLNLGQAKNALILGFGERVWWIVLTIILGGYLAIKIF